MLAPIVYAQDVEGTYKGDYSIEYLTKNYNLVTFGQKDNNLPNNLKSTIIGTKGSLSNFSNIEGPILINGDFTSTNGATYGTKDTSYESFIKGNVGSNVTTPAKRITNSDYVNFEEMYQQVINEQQKLVENSQYNINNSYIEIPQPGIYTLNNALHHGSNYVVGITIDNYKKDKLYVINNMKLIELGGYDIRIKNSTDSYYQSINDFRRNNEYTGNIIINYPNARYIRLATASGKIVAPKADVYFNPSYFNYGNNQGTDAILANSITAYNSSIAFTPYNSEAKIVENASEVTEPTDYADDLYTGDYSIEEMLKNYSVVTLGQKDFEKNTVFYRTGNYRKGSAKIFHIAGEFLINGDLDTSRIDLENTFATESTVTGNFKDYYPYRTKYWGNNQNYNGDFGTISSLYLKSNTDNYYYGAIYTQKDFINFERLYEHITEEQQMLTSGQTVEPEEVLHIQIGSNYVIEDISNVKEIVFEGYEDNKDMATYITILNNGNMTMPKVMAEDPENGYMTTNDYMGKKYATYSYEQYTFGPDHYFGNIVWNAPNATYIQLTEDAPFAGHLIAPNADVETPELHFSGCFIVNSLFTAGNTEAHFYPMTAGAVLGTFLENQRKINNPAPEPETQDDGETSGLGQKNPETSTGAKVVLLVALLILSVIGLIKFRNPKHEKIG